MSDNKKIAALVVVILIVAAFLVTRYMKKHSSRPTSSGVANVKFHADSVMNFKWTALEQKFEFSRANRLSQWSPPVHPQDVQDTLVFLAQSAQEKISKFGSPLVEVHLKLTARTEWTGAWDGDSFKWTEGPAAGFGRVLSDEENRLFAAGRYAFEPPQLEWCPDRFKSIAFITGDKGDTTFQHEKGAWTRSPATTTKIDVGTTVEQWMGKNCQIQVERRADPEILDKADAKILKFNKKPLWQAGFSFGDGPQKQATFLIFDKNRIALKTAGGEKHFYSASFIEALNALKTLN